MADDAQEADGPAGAQLISRAFEVLRAISRGPRDGRRLSELSMITGLKEATTRRILRALIHERVVSQDPASRLYRLGALAFEFGMLPNPYEAVLRQCDPYLEDVARKTGDTVFLCMRSGTEHVCLGRSEGSFPIRASMVSVGGRLPLGVGALGISILASLPDDEVTGVLSALEREYPQFPNLDRQKVGEKIDEARRTGFSNFPNMPMVGVQSVGVAVSGSGLSQAMGVATVAIVARFDDEHLRLTVDALHECARGIGETFRSNRAGTT
jgi:DNA-binding IclR family transcriptional regulator